MKPHRINRTYTASERTLSAYPYGGELTTARQAVSGIDHRGQDLSLAIGAGTPTGPTMNEEDGRAGHRLAEGEKTRQDLPEVFRDRASGTGMTYGTVCANTPAGMAGSRSRAAGTTTTMSMIGTGMTETRLMRVLPEHEKDRCANTGLSQEASSVVVIGI